MTFWLETERGARERLPDVHDEFAALDKAREVYPAGDDNPTQWMMRREANDDEDYVLVPGGPDGEEFTWMPRSMWQEGGPLALLDKEKRDE